MQDSIGDIATAGGIGALISWLATRLLSSPEKTRDSIDKLTKELHELVGELRDKNAILSERIGILEQVVTGDGQGLITAVGRLASAVERLDALVNRIDARMEKQS